MTNPEVFLQVYGELRIVHQFSKYFRDWEKLVSSMAREENYSELLLCGYGILFYTFFEAIKGQRLRSDREIEAFEAKSIIKSVILAFILLITSLL